MLAIIFTSALLLGTSVKLSLSSPVKHAHFPTLAPLYVSPERSQDIINNSYIVIFRDDIPPPVFTSHLQFIDYAKEVNPLLGNGSEQNGVAHVFDSVIAKGYSGWFSSGAIDMIRGRPEVKFVEQDQVVYTTDIQKNAPWGLARINHRNKYGQHWNHYTYPRDSGKGVMVYVIDTGVNIRHREFQGRARWGVTFHEKDGHTDYQGHGTHVAGTIASRLYGVAKKAEVTSVKVFPRKGGAASSIILKGFEWAVNDAHRLARTRRGYKGTVINMSLGGGYSRAENEAVDKAVRAGIHIVVSAGNDNKDACKASPASARLPITVGASKIKDVRATFSNHGKCVDIFAPGDDILSCGIKALDASARMSGTSMSAPHVSGLVAHFLSIHPRGRELNPQTTRLGSYVGALVEFIPRIFLYIFPTLPTHYDHEGHVEEKSVLDNALTPAEMKKALIRMASKGKIASSTLPPGTPNLIAYNNNKHQCP